MLIMLAGLTRVAPNAKRLMDQPAHTRSAACESPFRRQNQFSDLHEA